MHQELTALVALVVFHIKLRSRCSIKTLSYMVVGMCVLVYVCMRVYMCMYICMYACLYVCLCVCKYVYMSVCLYVCMPVCCMPVCLCLSGCLSVCLSVCLYICLSVCLAVCLAVCMYAGMHGCMDVCMYVCIRACRCICICVRVNGVYLHCRLARARALNLAGSSVTTGTGHIATHVREQGGDAGTKGAEGRDSGLQPAQIPPAVLQPDGDLRDGPGRGEPGAGQQTSEVAKARTKGGKHGGKGKHQQSPQAEHFGSSWKGNDWGQSSP